MFPGGVCSMAPGDTRDMILSFVGYVVQGQAYLILKPWDLYRERYWYIGVNGRPLGKNYWVGNSGNIEVAVPFDFGTQIGSVYACEVGDWDGFPEVNQIPSAEQILEDEITSKRFRVRWKAKYSLSTVSGDTQLTSITITGAVRGRNVEQVPQFPITRGRLYYTITRTNLPTYGDTIVRWFSGKTLVAEGRGNIVSTIECTAMNGSGLTISCALNYTDEVVHGAAYIEILWPKKYEIHYSTSALSYPRTPEFTFDDKGIDDYFWLTPPELAAGAYNYNILQVDDEGNVESVPSVPDDSPKTVNAAPIAPTIVRVGSPIAKYQNSGNKFQATSATLTEAFAVVAGTNRALIISVMVPIGATVSSVTYNGSGTVLMHTKTGTAFKLLLYIQNNPTVGTANVVVTCSASQASILAQWAQYNGVEFGTLFNFADDTDLNVQELTTEEQTHDENDITLIFGAAYGAGAKPSGIALNAGDDTIRNQYQNTGNVHNVMLAERRVFNGSLLEVGASELIDELLIVTGVLSCNTAGKEILWDNNGETGATYTVYQSNANEPINYGTHRPLPAPVGPSAVDATSATITLPTVTPPDHTTDYATLESNLLSAVQFLNGHFLTGESDFNTNRETFYDNVVLAVGVWGTAIGKALRKIKDGIEREYTALDTACDSVEELALPTEDWQNFIGPYYGNFLAFLSATLDGFSGRFNMGSGVMPGGALASSTTGTGAAPDGSTGSALFSIQDNLKAAGLPFIRKVYTRYVVRASKGGIEERNDIEFCLESDGAGTPIAARPNNSFINSVRFESGSIFITVGVLEENSNVLASAVEISVVAAGDPESFGNETALPEKEGNYHEVEIEFTMPGNGFFDVASRALSTNGGTSAEYQTQRIYYSSAVPASATNKSAAVVRGEPARASEATEE